MLRILHLEDRIDDAVLTQQALTDHGIAAHFTNVRDRAGLNSALAEKAYDLVLADCFLPNADPLQTLGIIREKLGDVGFISLSGAVGERQAFELLAAGASACVRKDRVVDLVAAVRAEERKLRSDRKQWAMSRLIMAIQQLSLARDLAGIMAVVRKAARDLTGADGATFVLREGEFCYYADENAIAPLWKGQRFPLNACISGWAMLNRTPAVIKDIYADPRIPADAYRPTFVKSLAMVPIRTECPIGAIGNYWATQRQPTSEEVELLQALANTTAVAMENVNVLQELEQRVKDRTIRLEKANAQLETANRELECFSYAVAHDLGAPLRAIGGFSEMISRECATALTENGLRYIQRVQASAKQMRELIDDLLRLSKIGRTELKRERVNLSHIAGEIIRKLIADMPDRKVHLRIAEDMAVDGDAGLLRIAVENLLSNAWKYSSKREVTEIEFYRHIENDAMVYTIRDNGVGFAMEDANRLFQPFQRLHSYDEFPGSGIGLTTVQRIIERHGGKIWAEGELDKGAAVHFTVPGV